MQMAAGRVVVISGLFHAKEIFILSKSLFEFTSRGPFITKKAIIFRSEL